LYVTDYLEAMQKKFSSAFTVAQQARSKGYDPENFVEITPAPDLASRVEGIIGVDGLAQIIRAKAGSASREALAFEVAKEVCTNEKFSSYKVQERLTLAVRVGLAVLTEGIVVAPTEGVQGVELHKTQEGADYIAVVYSGPIRSAGGTSVALSVALADLARKLLGIGEYRAQQTEVDRYIEEIPLYHSRIHLQYLPSDSDLRALVENCPVCIDGLPTEDLEVSVHRNMSRLDADGKPQAVTNRLRGGVALVISSIIQKAKSVLKHTKANGLDWGWLNNIIKISKGTTSQPGSDSSAEFLQELVAGRPILAYPGAAGGFRLRYGRSRFTGIAAKGFSPASMIILEDFIACGTQLRIEKPGKGCVAMPVDDIEGPFVKLASGEALRIDTVQQAQALKSQVKKIISVGDVLVTYGDFKKSNTPLMPTSYVEEFWAEQLRSAGCAEDVSRVPSFKQALELSEKHGVPMHPQYTYDYSEVSTNALLELARALGSAEIEKSGSGIFDVSGIVLDKGDDASTVTSTLERLCVPHKETGSKIAIPKEHAQCILASLGFVKDRKLSVPGSDLSAHADKEPLEMVNAIAPFKVMKRSTRIGGRIGRPEKAKERRMQPAPHALFPVGSLSGNDRSMFRLYGMEKRKIGNRGVELDVANYRCTLGNESICVPYCKKHGARAVLERTCMNCGRKSSGSTCDACGGRTIASKLRSVDVSEMIDGALATLGMHALPKGLKGVRGLINRDRIPEIIEKGILRAMNGVFAYKDGTARFDATDVPLTHFYPKEFSISVERLRQLGYTSDYLGNDLVDDTQLVELAHQDVVLNRQGAEYLLKVAKFVDDLLAKVYGLDSFYNASTVDDLIGQLVITLSPHTSAGMLCRVIGFTDARVGLAHPYVISARRRNCDGDEDTTILLLDALLNFSKRYLPTSIGGTMDAPLILVLRVDPKEVDDEVHDMEVVERYGIDFYNKTLEFASPADVSVELVGSRLGSGKEFSNLLFTHESSIDAIAQAPKRSIYTMLETMREKVELQFALTDRLYSVDRQDAAKRLILSHFIPDLIGNMHLFSKQGFRCISCNAKYRRVPLAGKCTRCNTGKLVLTVSRGGIEKYLVMAMELANRYDLEPYIKQRLMLIREEISNVFGGGVSDGSSAAAGRPTRQFNLAKFM
jgi:DNA polymerase II large subunit